MAPLVLVLWVDCGSSQNYSRTPGASGGDTGTPDAAPPDDAPATGGAGGEPDGSGGAPVATGGATDSGGRGGGGTGGRASGGASAGSGGARTGGMGGRVQASGGASGTGGAASGGMPATGGRGTGGAATGGAATGGAATGGAATGGAATGGAASGGMAATGGRGTGGAATGGAATGGQGTGGAPTRLILSIDFVGGRDATPAPAMAATETAGARPAANWNSATGPMGMLTALKLSDGSTSAASVTWNAPAQVANTTGTWTLGYTDEPGDVRMMNGYLDPSWTSVPTTATPIVTVSGLPAAIAATSYDIYVYTLGNLTGDMRSYRYEVGSLFHTVVQNSNPPVPPPTPYVYTSASNSQVGTHVVFTGMIGASFTIAARPVSGSVGRYRAPINGIQIVWPAGS